MIEFSVVNLTLEYQRTKRNIGFKKYFLSELRDLISLLLVNHLKP